ncbi:hypothetical protein F0562_001320 [Nyssa sinensis]|uniref:Protein kinase domain-containing protein n=1 Tax=Nyssa sinensis TaxID=561372 RepID=A0A5J5C6R4_9ASTE|nr:hypothetical protein F0562_001320 [Nyssa sinensis]
MTKLAPLVIYQDLKCSNILLDEGYHPKLSDFGLAKLGPVGDNTHVSTRVMGTYGYCAPEYAMTDQLTLKSDAYSFGVVLLEIITGRKAIKNSKTAGEHNLVAWLLIRRRRNHKQENRILSNWTQIQSLTMSTGSIIAINSLQSNHKIWTIEAMVLRQGIIETFNNVQNNGKIWKMILADNMGTKIQAVMFNEAIRKFEGIFQHSKAYLISNGTVKKPNEKFANVHPSIELVLQQHTNVQETTSTFDAHIFANEFVKFKKIQKHIEINPYVDIFGFVSSVGQSYVIKKKNGGETHKREITIMNKELDSLPITLSGDMALNEGQMLQENFDKKQIIVVSNLNGTTYQGQFQRSTTNMSTIQFDPHCVQVQKLKKWLHSSPTNEIDIQQLAVEKKIKQAKEINIRHLLTNPSPIMEMMLKIRINHGTMAVESAIKGSRKQEKDLNVTNVIPKMQNPSLGTILGLKSLMVMIRIVILFDEPATSLIGCTISDYINSVRKDKFTSHFYKKMVSCKSMQYKFLFNSNRVTHSATGQTLPIIAQGIEAAQADNFAKINEAETHETKKKRQLKKKIVEAIDAVESTPIEDEDINKSNPNEKELIEIEDDENLNAFYKRQKQIRRKKNPTILKKKIKLENV